MKLANEFIKFVVKELALPSLPRSIRFVGEEYAATHKTFGTYNPMTDEVVICKEGRHPVDVLRTLAHELVHHKQRVDGKVLDGEDGSDIENEANAVAGTLMRKFRKVRPDLFGHTVSPDDVLSRLKKAASTGMPQRVGEHYIDSFSARMVLEVMRGLTPEHRTRLLSESTSNMVRIAQRVFDR